MLAVLALVLAACGGDDPDATPATAPAAPTTALVAPTQAPATTEPADAGFPVEVRGAAIPAEPQRIVSLSATHTEVLYEIGAGPAVVATDLFSDYPAAAGDTDKIDAFNLNIEAVAALDPDLVILSFDPGDAVTGLAALGIPAVLFGAPGPTSLEDAYAEWLDLGAATGRGEDADALIARVGGDINEVVGQIPEMVRAFTYFVELDSTLFTAGEGTLIDSIFGLLGMENVADPADGPFPQLSPEFLIGADPDFIFLADTVCCGESAATVAARPGFAEMGAVANDQVIELDDAVASRWGPRVVDLVRAIAEEVYGLE